MSKLDERKVRLALLGCGTVGGGVLQLLNDNRKHLADRIGAEIEVAHVLVRDPKRARGACDPRLVTTDPERVFDDESIDVVVEVMGGEEPARGYLERALDGGKSVVSANKFLLARHGTALLERARARGVDLAFEASVGGGIPVIRTLRDSLTSDWVSSVHALLNGTCNYILTRMRDEGKPFDEILRDAQQLGYAEAEPSLDVDGHDATQKLVVLAMLAFGAQVDDQKVHVEGIRAIDEVDFRFAERYGFALKHLAIGIERAEALELRVHPALLPKHSPLASVNGVLNGVYVQGRALGPCWLVGQGAGALPTAVSVVADLVDVARARVAGAAGLATRAIQTRPRPLVPLDAIVSRYYLRFDVADEPGVLATIAGALGRHGVSVEHLVQEGRAGDDSTAVHVLMVTHTCTEGSVQAALREVNGAGFMQSSPRLIRIEDI